GSISAKIRRLRFPISGLGTFATGCTTYRPERPRPPTEVRAPALLEDQPFQIFRAAADGEKIHTYLQSLQQQQSLSRDQGQADNLEIIKEYDRLVDGPAARKQLEKERPSLVAARDSAVVQQKRQRFERELAARSARQLDMNKGLA